MLSKILRRSNATLPNFSRQFSTEEFRITKLHKYHSERLEGKMVGFAGYEMPVLYGGEKGGVLKEHLHTREACGIFDVSHMG